MAQPVSDEDYARFRSLVRLQTGLDFPPARRSDLEAALQSAIKQLQDSAHEAPQISLSQLYDAILSRNEQVWDVAIDALTICETHFLRNRPQFDALRDHLLPALIAQQRKRGTRTLNMWSAGCASGEEAYSLAILLRELLPDWQAWTLNIIGTDINNRSLEQARRAMYANWSFRETAAQHWREQYFTQDGALYALHDDIRQMVRFERCNLVESCSTLQQQYAPYHLILYRNVALYFGAEMRQQGYQRMFDMLAPGGWMVTGHADPRPTQYVPFEAHNFRGATCFRRPNGTPISHTPAAQMAELARGDSDPAGSTPPENDAEAQYRLGRWHADRQEWDRALFHCERAISLDPDCMEAHYTISLVHQHQGDHDRAVDALRHAIYLDREWPLPRFTLAGLYRAAGQFKQARRELRNVIAVTDRLSPEALIRGGDGLTAGRLRLAAQRQLDTLAEEPNSNQFSDE